MTTTEYPRVLIVGGPHGPQTATITTLKNLFYKWPQANLAQLVFGYVPSNVQDGIAERVFVIPPQCQPLDYYCRRVIRRAIPQTEGARLSYSTRRSEFHGLRSIKEFLRKNARAIADISPLYLDGSTKTFLSSFRPDLVYSLLASTRAISLATAVAAWCQCPLIPHFMDDWPTSLYAEWELLGMARIYALRQVRQTVNRAAKVLCISEAMAEEYTSRYGRPCKAFMNCADASRVDQGLKRLPEEPFVLCYIGNIQHGRFQLLRLIAEAAKKISICGRAVRIEIYPGHISKNDRDQLQSLGNVVVNGVFEDIQLEKIRTVVNAFVHLDSFEPEQRRFFRLSLSTKIPLYLSCGLPIFAFGPEEVGTMKYLRSLRCGVEVSEMSMSAVVTPLEHLVQAKEELQVWENNARQAAVRNHDREEQSNAFRSTLADLAFGDDRNEQA